eukprot:1138884-Pelagomonas_calceolata.AAC.6
MKQLRAPNKDAAMRSRPFPRQVKPSLRIRQTRPPALRAYKPAVEQQKQKREGYGSCIFIFLCHTSEEHNGVCLLLSTY